jgi:signal transduction histidine kinase
VAAFYTADVQINYLAELVTDKSVQVKEKVTLMLKEFLTEMGDRYDHQTRLLPYLLDLLTDDADSVSTIALETLRMCGQQYEEEHPNDIIEKRQYGVDGDIRINLDKPLPPPFTERPRIGVRLYVRGNTKRFLSALVNELTNWVSHTRLKSAKLLKVVVVLCEEHLTMESHFLLPAFIKALMFAGEDSDKELHSVLLEVYELVGR